MKYCTKCGEQNPDEAKFCAHCGEPLTAKKSVSNKISAMWNSDEVDLDQIKVIYADGYNIEAELDPNGVVETNKRACVCVDFEKAKLYSIDYNHPNSNVALSVSFLPEVKSHLFRPDEYTGRFLHVTLCTDASGEYIFDDEWWKKYGKMFYEDVEPLKAKLTEFFGFDIIEDKYWEEK